MDLTRAPGWYADGNGKGRWWDGEKWDATARAPRDAMIAGKTPAGWYPSGVNGQTYWDGRAWTDQHAPLAPRKNPAATASLVLAIVALGLAFLSDFIIVLIPTVVLLLLAVILGINGLDRARRPGGVGKRAATAGLVLSILPIIFVVVILSR